MNITTRLKRLESHIEKKDVWCECFLRNFKSAALSIYAYQEPSKNCQPQNIDGVCTVCLKMISRADAQFNGNVQTIYGGQ